MCEYQANDMMELCCSAPTAIVQEAFAKAYGKIHGFRTDKGDVEPLYKRIMVSVSGGSDSDVMMDFIERIGYPKGNLIYVFFDTGIEFAATKRHLDFLEEKYRVKIQRERAVVPSPIGVRKYGVPFLSKQISEFISRLQSHGFKWEDRPFDELYAEYPKCKAALRWWCNAFGENSRMNIERKRLLKEFMVEHPPDFPISNRCCDGAKKKTAHAVEAKYNPDLSVQGVRKAEGGARSTAYSSCYDQIPCGCDRLRPIFWFKKEDKESYEQEYGVTHSDCYSVYGLTRTGCACCPFGKNFEKELAAALEHEPLLYKAAVNVFGKFYEYTRQYREFVRSHDSFDQSEMVSE